MQVVEIKDIVRKELPIYYRRLYSGIAVMKLMDKLVEIPMDFQIEHKPTGLLDINLTLSEKVDYPLIPIQKELKKIIGDLENDRKLPD
jgi:hypothetical protein